MVEREFDWNRRTHRRALLEDELELPAGDARREELVRAQEAYRRARGVGPSALHLAKQFWRISRGSDVPDDRKGPAR